MAIASRTDLISYCLRKLGKPVVNINVAPEQLDDRVDDALQVYAEKHFDASENAWITYTLQQSDIDNGYIILPDDVLEVIEILPYNEVISHNNIFSFHYQVATQQLTAWQNFDQLDYFMKVTNYESINDMTSAQPRFSFSKHGKKLKLNRSLEELGVDYIIGIHSVIVYDPETVTAIYNDKWLKEYTTQLIKRQWGENMKKFGGVQLLGGVELNGKEIYDEAVEELQRLEEELEETYQLPVDFIVG